MLGEDLVRREVDFLGDALLQAEAGRPQGAPAEGAPTVNEGAPEAPQNVAP